MNAAFLTEMNFRGKIPTDHQNMRTEFAWMCALQSDHFNIHDYEQVKGYDAVFIIFPKSIVKLNAVGVEMTTPGPDKDISIYSKPIISALKKNNGKICNVQEGPSWFFNEYDMVTQFNFYNHLAECDILFAHNEYDVHFYKGLFPQTKVAVIPTLMIINNATCPAMFKKEEKAIIGGNFCHWYGGFQSYITATEFDCPIYVPSSHCKRKNEEQTPNLHHLPWVHWTEWMSQLSQFKYAVNLMPTIAAGTFSMNCLSGDTDVITLDGIKNIKDVNIGDYVISKNMTNGNSEWKIVISKTKSKPEKTYHIKGRSIDLIATGNHNLIIKKRDGKRKNNMGYKNEYNFEKVIDLYSQSHQPKARRKLPDFSEIKYSPSVTNSTYPMFSVDGASILGWFISEGEARNPIDYPSDNRIGIGQRKKMNEDNYKEILNLVKRIGYNPSCYNDRILFTSKILKYYFINNVGRLCHEKRIPLECFTWPIEMRRSLWEAMMKGDGDKKYTTYTTTSLQLQKDFSILSMTLGIGVTLSKPILQKSNKHHTLYQVYLRKVKGNLLYAHNISEYKEQETYCIEIEDNHNFVAGRSGKFQFIGNCAFFGIPCIGNEKVDTQQRLFPDLSVDVNDIHAARFMAIQLKQDPKFYEQVGNHARLKVIDNEYGNITKWIEYMEDVICE